MMNLLVFTKKSVFMQRIADAVRQGHHWHVSGQVTVAKADYLVEKFDRVFRISRTPVQAFRARQLGEATARLLLWMPEDDAEKLVWVLLKTDGKEYLPGHRPEQWRHAMEDDQRISLTGYWLVRMTKPGYPQPVWTWRYMPERYAEIRDAIVAAIRHRRDEELKQLIHVLWRSPGFAGVRTQVKEFKKLILAEWKRTRRKQEEMPVIPEHIGYVQRLPDKGVKLSAVIKKKKAVLAEEV